MPFANTDPKPDIVNLNMYKSLGFNLATPVQAKIKPLNQDNTVFDLTALTSLTVYLDNGIAFNAAGSAYQVPANTLVSHDATGAVFLLTGATLLTIIGSLAAGGRTGGKLAIKGTDGTTDVLLATGSWSGSEGI